MSQHFGPDNASLRIRTGRTGGAAKAGHDLLIEVESWQATLDREGQPYGRYVAAAGDCVLLTLDDSSLRAFRLSDGKQVGELTRLEIHEPAVRAGYGLQPVVRREIRADRRSGDRAARIVERDAFDGPEG